MGKGTQSSSGYNYFGSLAEVICMGKVTTLHEITNGETVIWTGPVDSTSMDAYGKTTLSTTIGTIHFYWGTGSQNVDSRLSTWQIDIGAGPITVPMSAYLNVCYAVCDDIAFGQQVTPPSLLFELERELDLLDITAHNIGDDAVLPEIVYDWLTNTLYGAGVPTTAIDKTSFETAAEIVIAEGIGISPLVDTSDTLREVVGKLMPYLDFLLYLDAGIIKMKLVRKESTAGIQAIDESSLTAEPTPANEGWGETWNTTRIVFTDRANAWEKEAVEVYDDAANAVIQAAEVPKEFQFSAVTQRSVAKLLAKRKGLQGGIPAMTWEFSVLPTLNTLKPGQLVSLSFAKRDIVSRVMRVTEVGRGSSEEPEVRVTAMEERTRDETYDYVPSADSFGVEPYMDRTGNVAWGLVDTVPRLSWLTTELKAGKQDGFLVACERPTDLTEGFRVHWTSEPGVIAYREIDLSVAFPIKAEVMFWHRMRGGTTWLLRVSVPGTHDQETLTAFLDSSLDLLCAVGRRLWKTVGSTKDEHQVDVCWLGVLDGGYQSPFSASVFDIEMTGAEFGSVDLLLETLAVDGVYPTLHCYIGRQSDFLFYTTDTLPFERNVRNSLKEPDPTLTRYIKTPVYNMLSEQAIAGLTAVEFDRNDPTMCANGTYSRDWGTRILSTYQVLDEAAGGAVGAVTHFRYAEVEEYDENLAAILWSCATTDQELLTQDIDKVLGFMVLTGVGFYNAA